MFKLRTTRRTVALAASAVALAASATIATGGTASAAGANWQEWVGNCFGYTLWNGNQVTGYVVPHNGAYCAVSIEQSTNGGYSWPSYWSTGFSNSPANTPTWWHGYASNGSILTDRVCIGDTTITLEYCSGNYN
ncbi:hypothetical protein [Kitasatospora kifunensis]|uniref:Uncharacterized protein n=1 Tax=Kitasatospora kifunensis TaxID=58351 RepID=A0A7W7RAU1_KITKI|nr:hypothetical protein [Kitasatospora kifunensis]MBB4928563.1 hypothetical protein [Kitasatospora kifunensis]